MHLTSICRLFYYKYYVVAVKFKFKYTVGAEAI